HHRRDRPAQGRRRRKGRLHDATIHQVREAVSDIIAERSQMTDGMSRMVLLSLAGHALLLASMVLAPAFWTSRVDREELPMLISLGGAPGPDAGGMTTITEKPVQRVADAGEKLSRP